MSVICSNVTDGTHQSPKWTEIGVPFLFQSNVKRGEISFDTKRSISLEDYAALTARTLIEYGDVLYTIVGSYGNAAMIRTHEKLCFQRHIAHLKPNDSVLPEFLETMMNQPSVKRQADERVTGIAQKTLTLRELRKLKVLRPPMVQQIQFRMVVEKLREVKRVAQQQQRSIEVLFASLKDRAFGRGL